MPAVTEFAAAKINLSLEVLGRRPDGYHELRSVVAFADVGDRLTLSAAEENALTVTGPFAQGVPVDASNLIWKAYAHLQQLISLPQVSVRLEKNLPLASGIGGGSADAAAMLRALLRLAGKQLDAHAVRGFAAIGADVPVCFLGEPCLMEGIGEKISALTGPLPSALVLVNPGLSCETAAVFKALGLQPGQMRPARATRGWRNDMTEAALKIQPAIGPVLEALRQTALSPVLMSGSGATCFGLAPTIATAEEEARKLAAQNPGWWITAARLSGPRR